MKKLKSLEDALKNRTKALESGCLEWIGMKTAAGYGVTRANGKSDYVHRHVYIAKYGPIPKGLVIDHLCRNRACINTDHMQVVTIAENAVRGIRVIQLHGGKHNGNSRQTHCRKGHALYGDNLYVSPKRPKHRQCKKCQRQRVREWRARNALST